MKAGVRALGVAESYRNGVSTLAGAVVRASRVVDGFAFGTCVVGGTDATDAVVDLFDRLGREDVRYCLLAGVAPAWFNFFDVPRLHEALDRPVLAVSFEDSEGLEPALREAFSGEALKERLAIYRRQPPRRPVAVGKEGGSDSEQSPGRRPRDGETVYVRAAGVDDAEAARVVRAFTPEGGRPEPLRVARLAARAADETFTSGGHADGDG